LKYLRERASMKIYRAVPRKGFNPEKVYRSHSSGRLPGNVPYVVDNLWEFTRARRETFQATCSASFGPNPGAISFLIEAGADVNRPRPNGVPILHWIHDEENLDVFLAAAVDFQAKDSQCRTALFAALDGWKYSDYPDDPLPPWKARRLIAAGANPDTPDKNGVTPRDLVIRDCIPIELPVKID
jgi:hypothetical protein